MKIKLGSNNEGPAGIPVVTKDDGPSKPSYPCLYITTDKAMKLPSGKFTFMCEGELKRKSEDLEAGKFNYEINVHSIEPGGKMKSKDDDMDGSGKSIADGLGRALAEAEEEDYEE